MPDMARGFNWDRTSKATTARSRGNARDEFDAEKRSRRPMTFAQRKYLNHLREELGMEPIYSGLTINEASEQIDRLKAVPREK